MNSSLVSIENKKQEPVTDGFCLRGRDLQEREHCKTIKQHLRGHTKKRALAYDNAECISPTEEDPLSSSNSSTGGAAMEGNDADEPLSTTASVLKELSGTRQEVERAREAAVQAWLASMPLAEELRRLRVKIAASRVLIRRQAARALLRCGGTRRKKVEQARGPKAPDPSKIPPARLRRGRGWPAGEATHPHGDDREKQRPQVKWRSVVSGSLAAPGRAGARVAVALPARH